jgi:hypothetical protein
VIVRSLEGEVTVHSTAAVPAGFVLGLVVAARYTAAAAFAHGAIA